MILRRGCYVALTAALIIVTTPGCSAVRRVVNFGGHALGVGNVFPVSYVDALRKAVRFVEINVKERRATPEETRRANQNAQWSRQQFTPQELQVAEKERADIAVPVGETSSHHLVMLADPETGEIQGDEVYEVPKSEVAKMDTLKAAEYRSDDIETGHSYPSYPQGNYQPPEIPAEQYDRLPPQYRQFYTRAGSGGGDAQRDPKTPPDSVVRPPANPPASGATASPRAGQGETRFGKLGGKKVVCKLS